jgi:hypothetical protein
MTKLSRTKPEIKVIWVAWSVSMLLILTFCIDRIMDFDLLSFEVFVSIVLFLIVLLLLVILSWVLIIRNRQAQTLEKHHVALDRLLALTDASDGEKKEHNK